MLTRITMVGIVAAAALVSSRATYLFTHPPRLDDAVIIVRDGDAAMGFVQVNLREETDSALITLRTNLVCKMYDAVAAPWGQRVNLASSNIKALAAVQIELEERGRE